MAPTPCLVVAPNWVGDLVMALPTLEALAASGRRLTIVARPHLAPLLGLTPAAAVVVTRAPTRSETIRRLRAAGCDEAVVLTNSFRGAWLAWRAGVPIRWGYKGDGRSLLLAPAVPRPPRSGHQLRDYDRLLAAIGVPETTASPRLHVTPEAGAVGDRALERAAVDAGERPLIGLSLGAEFGPSKRWPAGRFAETARRLRRSPLGCRAVLLAGPAEVDLAVAVHRETGGVFPVLGPDLDLAGLAGLLARLDLLVTNDSGPMHMAAAVGTPCVALFGPTDPRRTAPCGSGHRVLSRQRWCSPCFRRRCPLFHHRCLRDIGVDEVVAAAEDSLAAAGYSSS